MTITKSNSGTTKTRGAPTRACRVLLDVALGARRAAQLELVTIRVELICTHLRSRRRIDIKARRDLLAVRRAAPQDGLPYQSVAYERFPNLWPKGRER